MHEATMRRRESRCTLVLVAGATLLSAACGQADDPGGRITAFRQDTLVTARVVENSTACQVDAICSLELAFSDTAVIGVYGTGLRQAPPCQSPAEVTNIAFAIARDEQVDVVLSPCEDGLSIQRLVRRVAAPEAGT